MSLANRPPSHVVAIAAGSLALIGAVGFFIGRSTAQPKPRRKNIIRVGGPPEPRGILQEFVMTRIRGSNSVNHCVVLQIHIAHRNCRWNYDATFHSFTGFRSMYRSAFQSLVFIVQPDDEKALEKTQVCKWFWFAGKPSPFKKSRLQKRWPGSKDVPGHSKWPRNGMKLVLQMVAPGQACVQPFFINLRLVCSKSASSGELSLGGWFLVMQTHSRIAVYCANAALGVYKRLYRKKDVALLEWVSPFSPRIPSSQNCSIFLRC